VGQPHRDPAASIDDVALHTITVPTRDTRKLSILFGQRGTGCLPADERPTGIPGGLPSGEPSADRAVPVRLPTGPDRRFAAGRQGVRHSIG